MTGCSESIMRHFVVRRLFFCRLAFQVEYLRKEAQQFVASHAFGIPATMRFMAGAVVLVAALAQVKSSGWFMKSGGFTFKALFARSSDHKAEHHPRPCIPRTKIGSKAQ